MIFTQKTLAAGLLALLIWYLVKRTSYQRRKRGAKSPPGPRGLPIFGNAFDLAKDPHLIPTFNKWADRYGPIAAFRVFNQNMVVLSSEKVANDLLSKRGDIYSDRGTPPALSVFSGGVQPALIDKTDTWRRQRKLMHSLLSITQIDRYEPFMDIESKYTLLDLVETPEKFDDHLARYAYGIVSRSALGHRTKSMKDPFVVETHAVGDFAVNCFRPDKYISNLFPWALNLPSWMCSDFAVLDKARQELQKSILNKESERRALLNHGKAPKCLHSEYLASQDEYRVTDLEGGSVFSAFMAAGTRSPHNALLQFVVMMLENPEWMVKLQQAVDDVVGPERLPDFSDLPALPTVRAVVKETVRIRSVRAEIGIPHKLCQDDVYDGYFFSAGTIFHANASKMLVDEDIYPNGDVFNPARWLEKAFPTYKEPLSVHPNLQNFTSFGFGRRACPGWGFTERSILVVIARIAWAFNIKPAIDPATKKPVELQIRYEPVANPRPYPFPAVFEPRSDERSQLIRKLAEEARLSDPLP